MRTQPDVHEAFSLDSGHGEDNTSGFLLEDKRVIPSPRGRSLPEGVPLPGRGERGRGLGGRDIPTPSDHHRPFSRTALSFYRKRTAIEEGLRDFKGLLGLSG